MRSVIFAFTALFLYSWFPAYRTAGLRATAEGTVEAERFSIVKGGREYGYFGFDTANGAPTLTINNRKGVGARVIYRDNSSEFNLYDDQGILRFSVKVPDSNSTPVSLSMMSPDLATVFSVFSEGAETGAKVWVKDPSTGNTGRLLPR